MCLCVLLCKGKEYCVNTRVYLVFLVPLPQTSAADLDGLEEPQVEACSGALQPQAWKRRRKEWIYMLCRTYMNTAPPVHTCRFVAELKQPLPGCASAQGLCMAPTLENRDVQYLNSTW